MTRAYDDIYYTAPDGLTLYARDYGGKDGAPVVLCLHGLTRNSADFHNLATALGEDYRVISVDQRGRGLSAYDGDHSRYRPDIYCADMMALVSHLKLSKVIAIGTSMGGLMSMMMAATSPDLFRAVIINDIGPDIDPKGLDRIKGYVGGPRVFANWAEAGEALKAQGPDVFPDYDDTDWADFAHRTCREHSDGTIQFAYDPAISTPFKSEPSAAAPPDLWPAFDALSPVPLLIIRGALSDILAPATMAKMQARHPRCTAVDIPRIGHAPMLDEPDSLAAIKTFLESLDAN